jgi:hypothetical protein
MVTGDLTTCVSNLGFSFQVRTPQIIAKSTDTVHMVAGVSFIGRRNVILVVSPAFSLSFN